MKRNMVYASLFLLMVVLAGCAAKESRPVPSSIIFPSAPEEPRFVFIKNYASILDFKTLTKMDKFLGMIVEPFFQKPYGVAAMGEKIYVTDGPSALVAVLDTEEKSFSAIMNAGKVNLINPIGVAVSSDGSVFVSDARHKRVFKFDSNGQYVLDMGEKDELKLIAGLAVNNELGRLYLCDSYGHSVHVYSLTGEHLFAFGQRGEGNGEFHNPTNIAVDRRNGNIYVVDTQNFRVQVFDKDGKFIRRFGELGDGLGQFARPKGIGIDSEGHIYVVDAAFDNFQVFDEESHLLIALGKAGRGPAEFSIPAGLYVDEDDKVYVVDSVNARLSVFQYLSEKWKRENPDQYAAYLKLQQEQKLEEEKAQAAEQERAKASKQIKSKKRKKVQLDD